MKQLDLSNTAPLDNHIQFTVEGDYIDLHNCFDCTKIDTDPFNKTVAFHFESTSAYYIICFYNATPFQFLYDRVGFTNEKGLCFDCFSRIIALESKGGEWIDLPHDKRFYAISFHEGFDMVIEAERVYLIEADSKRLQTKRVLEEQLSSLSRQLESIRMKLADIEKHDEEETKPFLQERRQHRETMALLEQEQTQKQTELVSVVQQEQQLLTLASRITDD